MKPKWDYRAKVAGQVIQRKIHDVLVFTPQPSCWLLPWQDLENARAND